MLVLPAPLWPVWCVRALLPCGVVRWVWVVGVVVGFGLLKPPFHPPVVWLVWCAEVVGCGFQV